jgi:predicted ATP-dependent serine protease
MAYGHCFLCGKWNQLEEHHIFGGANRKKSEKYGLKVSLCALECHREGPHSVHRCAETARQLHEYGQRKFMQEQNATIDDFRAAFGRNYL